MCSMVVRIELDGGKNGREGEPKIGIRHKLYVGFRNLA